ncbi:ATP-binding protein [Streptomyces sp. SP2-10]|uniref:ATP-binding protein n=1 Tax=Streptomyces sp. SP2-10 TaxID=2873385 RepID=UPI00223BAD3F|nr:ATP-binding protein [Streptomyces sp. SP2-10]
MTCVASRAVSRHPPSAGPGCRVRVRVGDGSRGWAPTVFFDRVIAVYAVERIPWAWVAKRYEKGSIILTSNKTFSEWGQVFGDEMLATAILDRMLQHCGVIPIKGPTYRFKNRLAAIERERDDAA